MSRARHDSHTVALHVSCTSRQVVENPQWVVAVL